MEAVSEWFTGETLPVYEPGKDPYNKKQVAETQSLLDSSLEQLDRRLENAPQQEKECWLKAIEECDPSQIDSKFKLMFLRAESFQVEAAATKLLWYWQRRVQVYGDKAYEPLTLDRALRDDSVAMDIGLMRLLVGVKDPIGRAVVFVDPSRQRPGTYERESMVRVFWYMIHAALEDEEAQKNGVVFVGFSKNVEMSQFDQELVSLNAKSIKGALPIRISAFHVCHPPAFFHIVFPIIKLLLGSYLRNVIVHDGTEDQVLARLSRFGFDRTRLPADLGGDIELNHKHWLSERRSKML